MSGESMRSYGETAELVLERLEVLRRDHSWRCACGEVRIGPDEGTCPQCRELEEERRLRALPKRQALEGSRVPHNLRADFAWLADPWPRDRRSGGKAIEPLTWPDAFARDHSLPPALTLTGINGSGKSSRAAHILYLAYRAGLRPVYWVSEMELLDESRTWESRSRGCRHLYTNARTAGALVVDEVGTTRGAWADTETSINIMLQLVSHRLASRALTIYTSHRPLNKKAAEERGQDPSDSLRAIAPALFDRLTEGLIITLPSVSHRGKWAREGLNQPPRIAQETTS